MVSFLIQPKQNAQFGAPELTTAALCLYLLYTRFFYYAFIPFRIQLIMVTFLCSILWYDFVGGILKKMKSGLFNF